MPRGENRLSVLLSREENDQVFGLIGPKCQSLATAVVQLFTTEGPSHSEWRKKDTGVLCLVKDNGKRSYFFRIYCLYRKVLIWEHEVYMEIEYKSPRPYLHTFEAEEYMTAFNFASEDEARVLRNILIEKIELRKHRREERRQRSMLAVRANSSSSHGSGGAPPVARQNGVAHPPPAQPPTPVPMPKANMPGSNYTLKSTAGKKKPTRKLTKADIGTPQDFKHVSHVGWDANKGFDVGSMPDEEEMRSFLSMAGVSEKQLKNQATRQFIYEFINKNGGIDAVKEELHDAHKPHRVSSVPSEGPPAYSPGPGAPPAPPVPSRSPAPPHPPHPPHPPAPPSRAPPPPPARAVPPPPRNPPPPRPLQPPSTAPPSVPPPPPPPPPPAAPPPPPAPAPPPPPPPAPAYSSADAPAEAPAQFDPRAALMDSIRSGNKNLKHVEVAPKAVANEDSRSNLLSEIRQGVELRAVTRSNSAASPACPAGDGLAGALARALHERNRAIHSSDSEHSDSTSDGEWDD